MRIEHVALNVSDPAAMADWYAENLGMRIVLAADEPLVGRFLADEAGTMIELYRNEAAAIPDRSKEDPLVFHMAFTADDPEALRDRLVAAGASVHQELRPDDGSLIFMLRDPWGVPVQLCKRARPLG